MKISKADREDVGGCNFCSRHTYNKVIVIRSENHGSQLEVRFCYKCLDKIRNGTRWGVKQN
jgi:hypothetical protein